MFKLITGLVLSLFGTSVALAEESGRVNLYTVSTCAKMEQASKSLSQSYGEKPFALGTAFAEVPEHGTIEGVLIITVNPDTRTYTINMVFEEDDMVCMILSGDTFMPALDEPKINL